MYNVICFAVPSVRRVKVSYTTCRQPATNGPHPPSSQSRRNKSRSMLPVGVPYLWIFLGNPSSSGLFHSPLPQPNLTWALDHWRPLRGFWTYLPQKPGPQGFSSPFSSVLWTELFKDNPPFPASEWQAGHTPSQLALHLIPSRRGNYIPLGDRSCQNLEETNMLFSGRLGEFL